MAALAVGAPRPVLGPVPILPFLLQRRKKAASFKHWGAGGRGQGAGPAQMEAKVVQCLSDVLSCQTGRSFQSLGESVGRLG